jgi:hypothetical protein
VLADNAEARVLSGDRIRHMLVTSDCLKVKILIYNLIALDPWFQNFHGSHLEHVLTPQSLIIPRDE